MPKGKKSIQSPPVSYKFKSGERDNFLDIPVTGYENTVRTPGDSGKNQEYVINKILDSNYLGLRDRLYTALTRQTEYRPFSNNEYPADQRKDNYENIDSIHNQIHGIVGSVGHMAFVSFSAFDPIFFLHHTNIDRLFAIWEAINLDTYVVPQGNDAG